MPTTSVEKLSPTRAKLTISVTPEELKPSITHAYSHIAEQVNVPGFRKGKVPPPVVIRQLGRPTVLDETVRGQIGRWYVDAVETAGIHPVGCQ